jgi:hypothetical protein
MQRIENENGGFFLGWFFFFQVALPACHFFSAMPRFAVAGALEAVEAAVLNDVSPDDTSTRELVVKQTWQFVENVFGAHGIADALADGTLAFTAKLLDRLNFRLKHAGVSIFQEAVCSECKKLLAHLNGWSEDEAASAATFLVERCELPFLESCVDALGDPDDDDDGEDAELTATFKNLAGLVHKILRAGAGPQQQVIDEGDVDAKHVLGAGGVPDAREPRAGRVKAEHEGAGAATGRHSGAGAGWAAGTLDFSKGIRAALESLDLTDRLAEVHTLKSRLSERVAVLREAPRLQPAQVRAGLQRCAYSTSAVLEYCCSNS